MNPAARFFACLLGRRHAFLTYFYDDVARGRRIDPQRVADLRKNYVWANYLMMWGVWPCLIFWSNSWAVTLAAIPLGYLVGRNAASIKLVALPESAMHPNPEMDTTAFLTSLLERHPQLKPFYEANGLPKSGNQFLESLLVRYVTAVILGAPDHAFRKH